MQYLLMIYENEASQAARPKSESEAVFAAYMAFNKEVGATGKLGGGNALEPTSTATTVRLRGGDVISTDGPFAETKEQLGGYYLIEADDLDEAIAIAAKIPSAATGCIEVRPIMVIPGSPG